MSGKVSESRVFQSILKCLHVISVVSVMGGFLAMLLILLGRDMNTLSGTDFVYDKIVLWIFNGSSGIVVGEKSP